jgi:hypothetical protein
MLAILAGLLLGIYPLLPADRKTADEIPEVLR